MCQSLSTVCSMPRNVPVDSSAHGNSSQVQMTIQQRWPSVVTTLSWASEGAPSQYPITPGTIYLFCIQPHWLIATMPTVMQITLKLTSIPARTRRSISHLLFPHTPYQWHNESSFVGTINWIMSILTNWPLWWKTVKFGTLFHHKRPKSVMFCLPIRQVKKATSHNQRWTNWAPAPETWRWCFCGPIGSWLPWDYSHIERITDLHCLPLLQCMGWPLQYVRVCQNADQKGCLRNAGIQVGVWIFLQKAQS